MLTTTLPLLLCKFYLQTLSKRNILVFCAAGLVSDAIMCNHNATLGVKWIAVILQNLDWSYVRNIIQLFEPVQRPHPLFVQGEDCRVAISLLWIENSVSTNSTLDNSILQRKTLLHQAVIMCIQDIPPQLFMCWRSVTEHNGSKSLGASH